VAVLPTRLVEVEFDAGVWTDLAAYVVAVTTQRGRNKESGAFETGHLAVTLRNDDRRFDPDHSTGPYYGKLRPNRRIRVRATYDAGLGPFTYDVWFGYIDRITQQWAGPNDSTAVIEASDLFKLLQRIELPRSVYVAEKTTLAPDLWWPLDEPAGSTSVVDVGTSKVSGAVVAGTTLGASGLVVRDPGSAMGVVGTLTTGQGFVVQQILYPAAPISGTGPFTIEGWFVCGAQTDDGTIFFQGANTAGIYVWVKVRGAGAFVGLLQFNIGLINFVQSTIRVDDGAVHHFAATKDAVGSMKLIIDGVDRTASPVTDANTVPATDMNVGHVSGVGNGLTGTIQHLAVWRTYQMPVATAAVLNSAGRTPWNGDLSGARITRILDLAATPVGERAIDAGSTTLQSTSLGGTALAYLQKVEETEYGRLFVSAAGKLTFISRGNAVTGNYLLNQATLVDADSGAGQDYRAASADVDDGRIVTRATVSRQGSVAVTYYDAAAQAEFGWLDEVHEGLLHDTDAYSKAYAEYIVNTLKAPSSRIGAVTLELPFDPQDLYPTIFTLEIGEMVTFKRKPQNTGAVMSLVMRVEAIGHETGGGYWHTTLFLSPFNPAGGVPVGVWDTSLWDQAVWGF
jgi:hypothetical protein